VRLMRENAHVRAAFGATKADAAKPLGRKCGQEGFSVGEDATAHGVLMSIASALCASILLGRQI
jgi:hypothetical protein